MMSPQEREEHKKYMSEFIKLFNLINKKFNVSVGIFGRLGIQEYYNKYIGVSEIDILIPDSISKEEFIKFLDENKYVLSENNMFTKDGYDFRYDSFDKYLEICEITDLSNLMEVGIEIPSKEIQDDGKKLVEWVKKQHGFYFFGTEELLKIYKENKEMITLINQLKGD